MTDLSRNYYSALLLRRESDDEISLGRYAKLKSAMFAAKDAAYLRGLGWDWVVERVVNDTAINRRSSVAGFESLS